MIRKMIRKLNRLIDRLRPFYHYGAALLLALIFALYCSGRVGWFLVFMLALAPVLSVLMAWIFSYKLQVEADLAAALLSKGESREISFTFINPVRLPSSPVELPFWTTAGVELETDSLCAAILPKQKINLKVKVTAKHAGAARVVAAQAVVRDYLGLVRFKVKQSTLCTGEVYIIPEAAEMPTEKEFVRVLSTASAQAEENEETLDKAAASFGGFPGFEHRVYRPGDPVKRINWKLSAGKSELFVRLDETMAGTGITIVLDCTAVEWPKLDKSVNSILSEQSAYELETTMMERELEITLGIARQFLRHDQKVLLYYAENGKWFNHTLMQEDQIAEAQLLLAKQRYWAEDDLKPKQKLMLPPETGAILAVTTVPVEKTVEYYNFLKEQTGATVALYSVLHGEGRLL